MYQEIHLWDPASFSIILITIFISLISLVEIIKVVVSKPRYTLWIPATAADAADVYI